MSTLDATVSMLEAMPEDARIKEQILSDLEVSRQQIADGKGLDMENALNRMGKHHGFTGKA